jgi:hypothetical protein
MLMFVIQHQPHRALDSVVMVALLRCQDAAKTTWGAAARQLAPPGEPRLRRGYEARFFVTGGGLMSSPLRMERQATDVSLTGFDIAQLRLEAAVRDIGMAQLLSEVVTAAIRICGLIVTTGT